MTGKAGGGVTGGFPGSGGGGVTDGLPGKGGGGVTDGLPGKGGKAEEPLGAGGIDGTGESVLAPGKGGNGGRLEGFDDDGVGAGGGDDTAPGKGGRAGRALLPPVSGATISLPFPCGSRGVSCADASITPEFPAAGSETGGSVILISFS